MPVPADWSASIRSVNFPDRYVRHRGFLGYIEPLDPFAVEIHDGNFIIGPGLADARLFSIQSSNFPNHYLRHQGFRVKLQQHNGDDQQFAQDATFELTPALAYAYSDVEPAGISFRAYNFPDFFVRHFDFELWLHKHEDSEVFSKDSSFHVVASQRQIVVN